MADIASIVLVDDHVLLRNGLAALIKSLGYHVIFEADNGSDFCEKIKHSPIPDIVLLDINMPVMDGFETCKWINSNHPQIKVLSLSMYDNEKAILTMLKSGAKGYILKDSSPIQLKTALDDLIKTGFHYSQVADGKRMHAAINHNEANDPSAVYLSDREKEFILHSCTDLTYKEIADKMCVSPRTVDGYRDALFEKLNIGSRVSLAIYAIKSGMYKITEE